MHQCGRPAAWLRLGLLLAVFAMHGAWAASAAQEGERLARQVFERPSARDASMRGTMILTELGRSPRSRTMYCYRREIAPGDVSTLIRFVAPSDVHGIGLLTLDHAQAEPEQWLYLPALDRLHSIPLSNRDGRFIGTDLYYEDLLTREVSLDRHRLVGREEMDGITAEMLESVPINPASSVYTRRIAWIHPEALVPLRVDYFMSKNEAPVKRLTVRRIKKIQGYWTIMDSTMADLKSGHQTQITMETVVYDRGLPETLFTRDALQDPAREKPFRLQ